MSVHEKMTAIADAIRDKTGGTDALTLDDMAENVPKVYEAGKQELLSLHPEKTVSGNYISVDDVSELPHVVKCRVTGVDNPESVTVTRCGTNLFDKDDFTVAGGYFDGNGKYTTTSTSSYKTACIPCSPNTDYVLTKTKGARLEIGDFDRIPEKGDVINAHPKISVTQCVFKTTVNAKYILIYYYNAAVETDVTAEEIEATIMLNYGTTALSYEPYNGQTLTPSADGTVEGMTSTYPQMNIFTDNADAMLDVTYRISAGKKAEYDAFWDAYQQNGNRINYSNAFYGAGWNDTTYNPKYPIASNDVYAFASVFRYSEIRDIKVDIKVIAPSKLDATFASAPKLVSIPKITLVGDVEITSSTFQSCTALKNVTIEGVIGKSINFQWCPLTKESITNIINALSSTTSGQTCTFKKTAKEMAFIAEEWAALIANKTNWTFSLA